MARLGELTEGYKADSLVTRQDLWRGVMRAVHPYDLKLTEAEKRAVDIVHSNIEYRTLNSLVEEAMATGDVKAAVKLMKAHKPGELLRRLVALLRLTTTKAEAEALAKAVRKVGAKSTLTTLISAYNGAISANDDAARVNRVAGLNNAMLDRSNVVKVKEKHLKLVLGSLMEAMTELLKGKAAPTGVVGITSDQAVSLVKRDAATTDRTMARGEELTPAGEGDVVRIFSHWNNNQDYSGYMDVAATVLDEQFQALAGCGWNSWGSSRDWATYSGDKLVYPGDQAAEFVDVDLPALRKALPNAAWVAMSINSYSGWAMNKVDIIAGAMLRSDADKGATFDARSVVSAFKPTTESTQSVPLAVNVKTGQLFWLDSSNGSTGSCESAATDGTIGAIVYDELVRPRLTYGELALLWAMAHGADTVDGEVDREVLNGLMG